MTSRARSTLRIPPPTRQEIDALDALGVDAVVGMAIYTGTLDPDAIER